MSDDFKEAVRRGRKAQQQAKEEKKFAKIGAARSKFFGGKDGSSRSTMGRKGLNAPGNAEKLEINVPVKNGKAYVLRGIDFFCRRSQDDKDSSPIFDIIRTATSPEELDLAAIINDGFPVFAFEDKEGDVKYSGGVPYETGEQYKPAILAAAEQYRSMCALLSKMPKIKNGIKKLRSAKDLKTSERKVLMEVLNVDAEELAEMKLKELQKAYETYCCPAQTKNAKNNDKKGNDKKGKGKKGKGKKSTATDNQDQAQEPVAPLDTGATPDDGLDAPEDLPKGFKENEDLSLLLSIISQDKSDEYDSMPIEFQQQVLCAVANLTKREGRLPKRVEMEAIITAFKQEADSQEAEAPEDQQTDSPEDQPQPPQEQEAE